jgi:hypothetical protein
MTTEFAHHQPKVNMQEARLPPGANTTSEKLKRFVSDAGLETDHLPVTWKGKKSILTFASEEDVSRRRLISAFGSRNGEDASKRRSISAFVSKNGEDASRRRLTFAFGSVSVLHLALALAAEVYWLARKRKSGSSVDNALPVHHRLRVTTNVKKLSSAGGSAL